MNTQEDKVTMQQVSAAAFWEHLNKFRFVTAVSDKMTMSNKSGRYSRTVYYEVAEILADTCVPDPDKVVAVVHKPPTKSHGRFAMSYFINTQATPDKPCPLPTPDTSPAVS